MANSIAKFKVYTDLLDDVYKVSSVSSVLESDATLAKAGANANEIIIPKLDMDALGNYSRNDGYVKGNVTLTNETVTFNYDRGRKFTVDAMDDEETAGLAFGKLSSEFIRTKVSPELDAWRFAQYSGKADKKQSETLSDGAGVLVALQNAVSYMDDKEVSSENRHLFITPSLLVKAQSADITKVKDVLTTFTSVNKVPQSRFYTAVSLLDGTSSGEMAGGYKTIADKTVDSNVVKGSRKVNFLIVEKTAVLQFTKHLVSKAIPPEDNPDADAWVFNFRTYGLCDVYANKASGVYLSFDDTALSS